MDTTCLLVHVPRIFLLLVVVCCCFTRRAESAADNDESILESEEPHDEPGFSDPDKKLIVYLHNKLRRQEVSNRYIANMQFMVR